MVGERRTTLVLTKRSTSTFHGMSTPRTLNVGGSVRTFMTSDAMSCQLVCASSTSLPPPRIIIRNPRQLPSAATSQDALKGALNIVSSPLFTSKKTLTRKTGSLLSLCNAKELLQDNSDRISKLMRECKIVMNDHESESDCESDIDEWLWANIPTLCTYQKWWTYTSDLV